VAKPGFSAPVGRTSEVPPRFFFGGGRTGLEMKMLCSRITTGWAKKGGHRLCQHTHTRLVSRYQKGKTNLDFTEATDSEWQWHQLGHMHCKSAPRSRQITTPAPHHSVFCRPGALPAAQQTASKHRRHCQILADFNFFSLEDSSVNL